MVKALLAGISLIFAISAQAQNEFTIKGKISGLEDSTRIVLYRSDGQVMSQIAQDTVINECFTFKGETVDNAPEALMVSSHDKGFPNTWLDVWVAPGKETTVTGNNKLIRTWNVSADIQEQHDLNLYADACREECSKEQEIYIQLMDLFSKGRTGNPSEEEKNAIRNEMKELQKKTDSLRLISSQKEIEIMQQTPKGTVWMDKLLGQCKQSKYMENYPYKEDLIALYNKLSDNEKNSQAGKEITVCLYPPVTVKEGDEMADTDLYDLQGNIHHLADYKGKYLLVDFWSRGCGPCMMALPEMKEISEK